MLWRSDQSPEVTVTEEATGRGTEDLRLPSLSFGTATVGLDLCGLALPAYFGDSKPRPRKSGWCPEYPPGAGSLDSIQKH